MGREDKLCQTRWIVDINHIATGLSGIQPPSFFGGGAIGFGALVSIFDLIYIYLYAYIHMYIYIYTYVIHIFMF